MQIKTTVTVVLCKRQIKAGLPGGGLSGIATVDEFVGVAVTEEQYESLKIAALEIEGALAVVTVPQEIEFDLTKEMIL